ncbi:hypothetical protein BJAS_P3966 [Bathymodiolus japonicus methanotrophic gill symbiont]|uniref:hypothetical protein n=1 Tax=Bathymodiolus japonicus methanotrophic gill symbiont TaxID=113269 RepID=UPI001B513310|nr:hypothetical protein [Bathymodiolus japonicus methanotrophic gill symbiont]GFO73254.1 hypothetical protein BJAS_P3966 [Bathymodiolus japonicus methanotrophic gill symbiont]
MVAASSTKATQSDFTAGEVSPAVSERHNLDWYGSALSKCENAYVKTQGAVYNREGSYFIGEAGNSGNGHARLISFIYNKEQPYIILLLSGAIEIIFKDNFLTTVSGGQQRIRIVSPFLYPWAIKTANFADTITMTDGHNEVSVLKRYAHRDWRLETVDFANHVPKPTRVIVQNDKGETPKVLFGYAVTSVDAEGRESLPLLIKTVPLSKAEGFENRMHIYAANSVDSFNIYKEIVEGTGLFGFIGSCKLLYRPPNPEDSGFFVDANYAPQMENSPPRSNLPFASAGGRPKVVGFYQQRRIFGSTIDDPQKIFFTETGVIDSMRSSIPSKATDSIIQDIVSSSIGQIRHFITFEGLILLTSEAEMKVTEGSDFVITPNTFGVKTISNFGASRLTPILAGQSVLFSKEQGNRLIALNALGSGIPGLGDVEASDLTIRAEHIFEGESMVDMTYSEEPNGIVWIVTSGGRMIGLTYDKDQKVWGFHRHSTQGKYKSLATIPNGNESSTYAVVHRNIAGREKVYIEKFVSRKDDNPSDSFFMDCGLTFAGSPTNTLRGLHHLEGKEVSVLADGRPINGLVVTRGGITLPNGLTTIKAHVGLGYETIIETMPIVSARMPSSGQVKSVHKAYLDIYNTDSLSVATIDDKLNDYKFVEMQSDNVKYSFGGGESEGVTELKTGIRHIDIASKLTDYGKISIKHTTPLPMCIRSITMEFSKND